MRKGEEKDWERDSKKNNDSSMLDQTHAGKSLVVGLV